MSYSKSFKCIRQVSNNRIVRLNDLPKVARWLVNPGILALEFLLLDTVCLLRTLFANLEFLESTYQSKIGRQSNTKQYKLYKMEQYMLHIL